MKKSLYILTLLSLFITTSALAQGWERVYFSDDYETGNVLLQTNDNGYAVAGDTYVGAEGTNGVLLARFDENGAPLWKTFFETDSVGLGEEMLLTPENGFLLAGTALEIDPTFLNRGFLLKTDDQGNLLWRNYYSGDDYSGFHSVAHAGDGGYIAAGVISQVNDNFPYIVHVNPDGTVISTLVYTEKPYWTANSIKPSGDGNFIIAGNNSNVGLGVFLWKIDLDGNILWEKEFSGPGWSVDLAIAENNDILFCTRDTVYRTDDSGNQIWSVPLAVDQQSLGSNPTISATTDDGLAIHTRTLPGPGFFYGAPTLIRKDGSGNTVWVKNYGQNYPEAGIHNTSMIQTSDEGFAMVNGFYLAPSSNIYLVKTNELGDVYSNVVHGNVFIDNVQNCAFDDGELPVWEGWLIEAVGTQIFYSTTDADGNYDLLLDVDTYTINILPPSNLWLPCAIAPVTFSDFYNDLPLDIPVQVTDDCPSLYTDISTSFLRRCFDNTYSLSYCNWGTIIAEDAYVEVLMDPFFIYISSTLSPSSQVGQLLTFDLGNLAPGDCGIINIVVYLQCDSTEIGQTHCMEAHIFPDTICGESWTGPNIEISGECEGDSIQFLITNVGGDMTEDLQYFVIEDNIILMHAYFQLNSGEDSEVPKVQMPNATYRLEAEQANDFPPVLGGPVASLTIEGCDGINPGLFTMFEEDDGEPYLSIDCQESIGAYDPNIKQGFPKGYAEEHLIKPNTDIEYHIHFQNTGTDTAFTVMIKDTLAKELDISTFRPGASSHSYQYEVIGEGVLKFVFSNIMLPDSNINEVASHGFVKFRISPERDLALGTVIENSAGIYFDFNAPIITNTTWHTLGENFLEVIDITYEPTIQTNIKIYPNPFHQSTMLEIGDHLFQNGIASLYSLAGRLIYQQGFKESKFEFRPPVLSQGFYFLQIDLDGQQVMNGKVIIK